MCTAECTVYGLDCVQRSPLCMGRVHQSALCMGRVHQNALGMGHVHQAVCDLPTRGVEVKSQHVCADEFLNERQHWQEYNPWGD